MTHTERRATIGENLLSQLRSRSHLSLSIIRAAPFNQNTVCFLSYTSCHCLKRWDSSLSSNTCCDVYIALALAQRNAGELQDIAYAHCTHLCAPSWVAFIQTWATQLGDREKERQPWKLLTSPALLVSSSGVDQWDLIRGNLHGSVLHLLLTFFNPESLKADWNSEKYQLCSDRFNFKTLGFSMFLL